LGLGLRVFLPLDSREKWRMTPIERCYAGARRSLKAIGMGGLFSALYAADPRLTYLDIGATFQTPTGELNAALYSDPLRPQPGPSLHPNTVGQRRMAEAIEPTLAKLLGETVDGR